MPVVTLLLTPKESDRLALAATASESIWLSMRKPRDNTKRKTPKTVTINQILKIQKKKKKDPKEVSKRPVRKQTKPKGHVVEIYQGSKRSTAKF